MTYNEWVEKYVKETKDEHNFEEWNQLGYKGQGVKILNLEGYDGHGKSTYDTILKSNLESQVDWCQMGFGLKADVLYHLNITTKDRNYKLENLDEFGEFLKEYDIITVSQSGSYGSQLEDLFSKSGAVLISSAGNDDFDGVTGRFKDIGFSIGAVEYRNGKIIRESYSAVGPKLDFVFFHYEKEGTSFSAPTAADFCARILGKYPHTNKYQMYDVLVDLCVDLGEANKDQYFGHGLPVLPENGVIDMLEIDNKLYTVDEIIEELKKYNKKEFHIHHTWVPDLEDFTGSNHERLQDSMRNFHMNERGFADIAQHITQFPDGKFMMGRDWSWIPASSKGYRADGRPWNQSFVFMIENIGNFDKEEIPKIMWDNNVKIGAYFLKNKGTIIFHRQMDNGKSCPGNKFSYEKYIQEVIDLVEGTKQEKEHWAEKHFQNLKAKGIIIHERRFEDDIDRDETFAMLDRITDDYIKRIDVLQKQIDDIKNS